MKGLFVTGILVLMSMVLKAGNVDSIMIFSASMKKSIPCIVIRPASYKKSLKAKQRLPVVYLLHGYSGTQRAWLKDAPQIQQKADELNVLLVCPDGGFSSWYFDSPLDSTVRYETFVSKELVRYIDSAYFTLADRDNRAITGLSMGGHGGLYLGIRHQDVFGLAGSICGGVDLRPFPNNWEIKKRIGDSVSHPDNWKNFSVISQLDKLDSGKLKLIIDCGISDFFLGVNRNLHKALLDKNIPHDYTERPGGHNGAYWGNSIDYQLLFFRKNFKAKQ